MIILMPDFDLVNQSNVDLIMFVKPSMTTIKAPVDRSLKII